MNSPIKITTNEQGSEVVSAREMYEFLGFDFSQWSRWSKKNIVNNQFAQENIDWVGFDIMSNGNPTKDFALTVDFAERLSMLARTEKGEEIRKWFQSLKKKVVESLPATQDELILMLAQRNVDNARRLSVVEEKLERIEKIQEEATAELMALPAPTEEMPEMPVEAQINRMVNTYAVAKAMPQPEVWRKIYTELLYRYRISVNAYNRAKGESKLQLLKRLGHLDKVFTIATNILKVTEPTT